QTLVGMMDDIRARAREIERTTQTAIAFRPMAQVMPAVATPEVQSAIERASASLDLGTTRLPSGAGHDAQSMAQLGPMGMIFVPGVGGISHSPKELTTWQDCANGADVLLRTVLEMDAVG